MKPENSKRRSTLVLLPLCAVGALAVLAHWLRLAPPEGLVLPPGRGFYSDHFAEFDLHPVATHLHMALAFALAIAIPIQFWDAFRNRYLFAHRILGRFLVGGGLICAVTGIYLGSRIP